MVYATMIYRLAGFVLLLLCGLPCLGNSLDADTTSKLKQLSSVEFSLNPTLDFTGVFADDRFGENLVKDQHRWRSASDRFAERCWREAVLQTADYYLSPGDKNLRDVHLFLDVIRAALKHPSPPVHRPFDQALGGDPLQGQMASDEDFLRYKHAERPSRRTLPLNGSHFKPAEL